MYTRAYQEGIGWEMILENNAVDRVNLYRSGGCHTSCKGKRGNGPRMRAEGCRSSESVV